MGIDKAGKHGIPCKINLFAVPVMINLINIRDTFDNFSISDYNSPILECFNMAIKELHVVIQPVTRCHLLSPSH